MGYTATDSTCLMKTSGGRFGTNLSKLLPRGCFPEKADTKGERGGISPGQNGWGHRFKNASFEHEVDSREGGIMLSQAGKTVVPSKNSNVCQ